MPVAARLAAQSAVQDGAEALVVDVAGPTTLRGRGRRPDRAGRRLDAGPGRGRAPPGFGRRRNDPASIRVDRSVRRARMAEQILQAEASSITSPTRIDRRLSTGRRVRSRRLRPRRVRSTPRPAEVRGVRLPRRETCATGFRLRQAEAFFDFGAAPGRSMTSGHMTIRRTHQHRAANQRADPGSRGPARWPQRRDRRHRSDRPGPEARPGGRPRPGRDRPAGQAASLQAHGLRQVQVRERPEGP